MSEPINPQKALEDIAKSAPLYAQAKADRVYLEQYRKTLKATLMQQAMMAGHSAVIAQEREAYADPKYQTHLQGLREAVETEERLRWRMVAAEAAVEVWRTQSANERRMDRGTQ